MAPHARVWPPLLFALACGEDPSVGLDAGPRADGGVGVDAGAGSDGGVGGDGGGGLDCAEFREPFSAEFDLGTAHFTASGCSFLGGGHTMGYELSRFSVEDSSPQLMPADRRRFELSTAAELAAALDYRWNHHNACDSFHLTLPHAEYAASAAPLAGCGAQVPEAPPRSFDEPSGAPVKYRLRYYGGPWSDGEVPGCSHYLISCGP